MNQAAQVNYHVKKPAIQAFLFDVDGTAGNIVAPELVPTKVQVRDIRDSITSLTFAEDGITFKYHRSSVPLLGQPLSWEAAYNEELQALLQNTIGATEVIIFDHTVRIDDQNAERKPARNVHNDYNEASARQRLVDILGPGRAREFEKGHYGFVNVWRPIETTVKSTPLGFIHPSSVHVDDWVTVQLVYPDRTGQILGVASNKVHDWFYLSNMTPDEVAIFNIYDNQGAPFLGHSALDMDGPGTTTTPRKSIESRALVRYSK